MMIMLTVCDMIVKIQAKGIFNIVCSKNIVHMPVNIHAYFAIASLNS